MIKKLAVLMFALLFAMPAHASKEDKVKELIELMGMPSSYGLEQQAVYPISCAFGLSEEDEKELARKIAVALDMDNKVYEIAVPFWEANFSEEELDDLLVFYRSETGQKVVKTMPKMSQYMLEKMMAYQQEIAPKLKRIFEQVAEVRKPVDEAEMTKCMQGKMGH